VLFIYLREENHYVKRWRQIFMMLYGQFGTGMLWRICLGIPTIHTGARRVEVWTSWGQCSFQKHLFASMLLSDCIALVVIVDAIGFTQGVMEIMEETGCTVPTLTIECLKQWERKREYNEIYKSNIDNRQWCGRQYNRKSRMPYRIVKTMRRMGLNADLVWW